MSLNRTYQNLIAETLKNGRVVVTRGSSTREILGCGFDLENPRDRLITLPSRKMSLPLAFGEFCWHLSVSTSVEFLSYYASIWKNFSEDGESISGSCYGHSIFSASHTNSQWNKVKQLLQRDPNSRRAVLQFYDHNLGLDETILDISCTMFTQFFIRENKLDCLTFMRSNDIILGLPYDIFFFTMLHEIMAAELGVGLGTYSHRVGSMHIYDHHLDWAKKILKDSPQESAGMPPMQGIEQISSFLDAEELIRVNHWDSVSEQINKVDLNEYWMELLNVFITFKQKKRNKEYAK